MTQTQAFEKSLARNADVCVVHGKFAAIDSITTTPNAIFVLNPSSLGARAAAIASAYSRFRVKYVRVKFITNTSVATYAAVGFIDDTSTSTATLPTNPSGVAELRCSATNFGLETIPTEFSWEPVDPKTWYHCAAESSTSDNRFTIPAVLYSCGTGAGSLIYELDYCVVFQGAIDTGSN
jgi:hypothetical protein